MEVIARTVLLLVYAVNVVCVVINSYNNYLQDVVISFSFLPTMLAFCDVLSVNIL